MADHAVFFDDLLREPNLRAKVYELQEPAPGGLACVSLEARRMSDWFFARRWVSIAAGRRLLYWLLDELEANGFRFRVSSTRAVAGIGAAPDGAWASARVQWSELTLEERAIHEELFPHEQRLLDAGYDWDHEGVRLNGGALPRDSYNRVLEQVDGVVYEWIRVPLEFTWRRMPLYTVASTRADQPSAPSVSA